MAQSSTEQTTVARPYAVAVFQRAKDSESLDQWSETLGFMAAVAQDEDMSRMIANPALTAEQLSETMIDIAGDNLNDEGKNLVRMLVANGRANVLPEIARQYEVLKANSQGSIEVEVTSAYAVTQAQKTKLEKALAEHLGKEVKVSTHKDADLIGGVIIRAGDYVIDGSVRGRLQKMAATLNS